MRSDASPATYRGCEQFVSAVCELASDFHVFHELRRLRGDEHHRSELLELSRLVHGQLNLAATAYAVANEGRRVLGCDRLSVLVGRGRSCKLLAASGVSRIERRSGAARRLSKVAELVRRTDEPATTRTASAMRYRQWRRRLGGMWKSAMRARCGDSTGANQ